jgi:hypothetical protein
MVARHLLCSSDCVPGIEEATASNTGRIRVMKGKRFERREVDVAEPTKAADAAMHVTAPMT